ncbi:D-amino acid oxidase, variant 2 [Metarhizium acridum]|uniref:D-amino acid oxidase, variant 2 n=1 Tax=Metarhizium acridum TaxID=92637 RepID=UPI001C6CC77A|nr:D-amino acid oxidase, variant 2 [Metarhizium acridum]
MPLWSLGKLEFLNPSDNINEQYKLSQEKSAGVSGLTTALLLSKSNANVVTIIAKHMPGDYDIEYASPWAGANFLPMSTRENSRWERRIWPEIKRITEEVPEAGIHFQTSRIFRRDKDMRGPSCPSDPMFDHDPWFQSVLPDYKELDAASLPAGHDSGCEFTSVCINTAMYLQWLVGQCIKNGVVLKRAVISHIREAKDYSHAGKPADVIVNATGLGSLGLGGVEDQAMAPSRGQTVLVRNELHPMITTSGTEDGLPEILYTMQRPAGGGTILGGTYDIGNWESVPDPNIALRIMRRVVEVCPEIAGGKGIDGLSVIRHGAGLRPYRKTGVRVDRERLDDGTHIVHNYGHAGWGYQGSYGCAEGVVELVNAIREENGESLVTEPKLFSWDN